MSKQSQAVTTTVAEQQPQSLYIIGPVANALEQANAHIRAGYVFDTNLPVEFFGATGMMSFTLKLGNPAEHFIELAKEATAEAMQVQEAQRQRDIERAAAELVVARDRAAAQAAMQAKVKAVEAELAALKAAAGAA